MHVLCYITEQNRTGHDRTGQYRTLVFVPASVLALTLALVHVLVLKGEGFGPRAKGLGLG